MTYWLVSKYPECLCEGRDARVSMIGFIRSVSVFVLLALIPLLLLSYFLYC